MREQDQPGPSSLQFSRVPPDQRGRFALPVWLVIGAVAFAAGCSADTANSSSGRGAPSSTAGTVPGASTGIGQQNAPGAPGAPSGSGLNGAGAASGGQPPPTTAKLDAGGTAANCDPQAPDQVDCQCSKAGITRSCWGGAAAARNVGVCKDGVQTCAATTGEFGAKWGPCMQQVLPTTCSMDVDAHCTGKVGCADPQCATELKCMDGGPMDAGMMKDSAVPPGCHLVQGFNGNGTLADGSLFCEGDPLINLFP
jgi:hypothetical protein